MEFDFALLGDRANRRMAALVTVTGIVIPSFCGWGFGQLSADRLAPGISVPAYSLFIAIALSITAVPILGWILMEFGLTRNRIGVISIAAAAANDALGWVLLAVFFLLIFFTFTGLRTDVGSLNTGEDWLWRAVLMAAAMLGKFGGCYLAARVGGLTPAESRCIGILMNTRAMMELIVINLGRDLGVIPAKVFTMLVLMAVVSILITVPGLRLWLPAALGR